MNRSLPDPTRAREFAEARRLAALERLHILDTPPEREFDDLVTIASTLFGAPIALVSLVDADRQWFKARVGLDATETHRALAFCAHAIETPDRILAIEDATRDARFANNPLVTGDPHIRFYAGAPITSPDGEAVGTVCVIDRRPRSLDPQQARCLQALGRHASRLLALRGMAMASAHDAAVLSEHNAVLVDDVASRRREVDGLWDRSADLLAIVDDGLRLMRVSPSWTKALCAAGEAAAGQSLLAWLHPDDTARVTAAFENVSPSGPVAFTTRMPSADGAWRWIAWTWTAEPDRVARAGVGRDVTEAKQRQAELEAAEAALRQSQKMEALGQLTGGLAHDFNNLLTGISGSLELAQLRVAQGRIADLDRYLVTAQSGTRRAAALTHRLLAFARRQTLDAKATDVARLVAALEEMIRRTVGPQVVVEATFASPAWSAMVDADQLDNALLNLCINARDAMPAGGHLTIATENATLDTAAAARLDLRAGQYVTVSVTDTGSGMSEEIAKRAFEPFFTTKPLGAGTGLGLSMVYGFARQSGGHVAIASTAGVGTTMTVYLPRSATRVAEVHDGARPVASLAPGRAETVLVIDDEPTVRMLVAEILQEFGYRSLEAQDGVTGLALLQSDERIDLLVTDVGLPGPLNGRQVADAARLVRPELRILFITGYAESAAFSGVRLGDGMEVLTKPFSVDDLSRRIAVMLGREVT